MSGDLLRLCHLGYGVVSRCHQVQHHRQVCMSLCLCYENEIWSNIGFIQTVIHRHKKLSSKHRDESPIRNAVNISVCERLNVSVYDYLIYKKVWICNEKSENWSVLTQLVFSWNFTFDWCATQNILRFSAIFSCCWDYNLICCHCVFVFLPSVHLKMEPDRHQLFSFRAVLR